MKSGHRVFWLVAVLLASAQLVFAGSPLKGIDVKLGKRPGGGCSARVTDASGKANFGVWPKGNYTISIDPQTASAPTAQKIARPMNPDLKSSAPTASKFHLVLTGASTGRIERNIESGNTARNAPIEFSLNGKDELVVVLTAAEE